jgi:hypothetical protein
MGHRRLGQLTHQASGQKVASLKLSFFKGNVVGNKEALGPDLPETHGREGNRALWAAVSMFPIRTDPSCGIGMALALKISTR